MSRAAPIFYLFNYVFYLYNYYYSKVVFNAVLNFPEKISCIIRGIPVVNPI